MISLVGELDFGDLSPEARRAKGEAKSSRYFIYLAQKNSQKRFKSTIALATVEAFVNKVSKNEVR